MRHRSAPATLRRLFICGILSSTCLLAQAFLRKDTIVGLEPDAVIPGDFNADGRVDLAVGTADGLYVLLNTGDGNFAAPIHTQAAPRTFWLEKGADFNGDGFDDLVGSSFLYLSNGDGTFQEPLYAGAQEAVAAGDFNGDSKPDLVLAGYAGGVRVLLGNGDGTFSPGASLTSARGKQVRAVDFNHDGRTDVAVIPIDITKPPPPKDSLLVFLAQGDGSFRDAIPTQIESPIALADFNGDGVPDLLEGGYPHRTSPILVALGKGDGTFQTAVSPFDPGTQIPGEWSAVGDFTGDGYADLILVRDPAVSEYVYNVYLYPGKGDGMLSAPVSVEPVGTFAGPAIDLDGDGRADLATLNPFHTSISVLLSRAQFEPVMRRATSAAHDLAIASPESLATLYGPTPAMAELSSSPPFPTTLGGLSLQVRDSAGATHLAPLLFVSSTQINFLVPADTALGEATLSIVSGGETMIAGSMEVDAVSPTLFEFFTGEIVEPDGTRTPVAEVACEPDWGCYNEPIPLAAANKSVYLTFYGTGFHGAAADNVTCVLQSFYYGTAEVQATVSSAGPSQTPGVDQITFQLPAEVFQPPGDIGVNVVIRIHGVPANPGWIWIL